MLGIVIAKLRHYIVNRSMSSRLSYLRAQGAKIGKGTVLSCNTAAFGTEPYLIEVGENVWLSAGVQLFTHDGGIMVLNRIGWFDGKRMDKMGRIKIGSNVYIGTNAMILPDVTIGDNCVIGAGAIVTKDVPPNSVAVGIPARVISTLEEYGKRTEGRVYPTVGMPPEEKKAYLIEHVK